MNVMNFLRYRTKAWFWYCVSYPSLLVMGLLSVHACISHSSKIMPLWNKLSIEGNKQNTTTCTLPLDNFELSCKHIFIRMLCPFARVDSVLCKPAYFLLIFNLFPWSLIIFILLDCFQYRKMYYNNRFNDNEYLCCTVNLYLIITGGAIFQGQIDSFSFDWSKS